MDYDNDGILDFISGSYDPGDIYLFQGLGKGTYAQGISIEDENGIPLVHHPQQLAKYLDYQKQLEASSEKEEYDPQHESIGWRVASFGSWPFPVDWDNDQDLDILIGSFGGNLFLRENIGSREEPRYSGQSVQILSEDSLLKVANHAAPMVADWDRDGLWDLVIGAGDGSVGWHRNIGKIGSPEFGSRQLLVAANENVVAEKFVQQNLAPGEEPQPGARSQIFVYDYNRDGWLDLLVGDHSDINWTKELTEAETASFAELEEELKQLGQQLTETQQLVYGPEAKDLDAETKAGHEARYQELVSQLEELDKQRKEFYLESRSASFIWVYLRQPDSNVEPDASPTKTRPPRTATQTAGAGGDQPVSFDANLQPSKSGDGHTLVVQFDIREGWHMYARDSRGWVGRPAVASVANRRIGGRRLESSPGSALTQEQRR